ncbi:MAG: hypothetical protein WC456_02690 [Patescibacteria group bacterium]
MENYQNPEYFDSILEEKRRFFQNVFGIELADFSGLKLPLRPEGDLAYDLLIKPRGLNMQEIIKLNRSDCKIMVDARIDLGAIDIRADGSKYKTSIGWIIDSLKADYVGSHSQMSHHDTETISDRLIHGLFVYYKTQRHLDEIQPTITKSYIMLKDRYPLVVKFSGGGMLVSYLPKNTFGGGRIVRDRIEF